MSRARQTCEICTETRAVSKFVRCPYCSYDACVECYKQVLLGSINPPSCMQPECKKQFSDDFVHENFPATWMNGLYRSHVEDTMTSKEMALLPQTQPHIDRLKELEETHKKMEQIRWEIEKMKSAYEALRVHSYNLENRPVAVQNTTSVVCACPVADCRGFISSHHKCGVCDVKVCDKCHEVKKSDEDEHKCNADTVATVEEMRKTCKNCPNCMTAIYKTEGCDQMWCVKCHVAFNWRTGKVEKGIIHNPHYFEFLRKNGGDAPRNPHEVRCGGMPDPHRLGDRRIGLAQIPVTQRYGRSYKSAGTLVADIYQKVVHVQRVVLPGLPTVIDNETNLDLRIKYMRNEIDKDKFTETIYRRNKDRKKKLEYRDVLDTYCNVMQDLFNRLFENFDVKAFIEAESRVGTFAGESIDRLNKKYKSKMPVLVV